MAAKLNGKTKIAGMISAALVASTPGIYSAWQSAKNTYQQSVEQKTRDTQEDDLQKTAKAHASAIDALEKTCVTHKDLLALTLQLQQVRTAAAQPRRRRRGDSEELRRQNAALAKKLTALQAKAKDETRIKAKLARAKRARPKLKKAAAVRRMVQRKAAE